MKVDKDLWVDPEQVVGIHQVEAETLEDQGVVFFTTHLFLKSGQTIEVYLPAQVIWVEINRSRLESSGAPTS